jgi:glutamine synthetase
MNKKEIIEKIATNNVSYLKLAFSDLLGNLKVVEVPVSQIDDVIDCNIMFDGSSIEGLVRINESVFSTRFSFVCCSALGKML